MGAGGRDHLGQLAGAGRQVEHVTSRGVLQRPHDGGGRVARPRLAIDIGDASERPRAPAVGFVHLPRIRSTTGWSSCYTTLPPPASARRTISTAGRAVQSGWRTCATTSLSV